MSTHSKYSMTKYSDTNNNVKLLLVGKSEFESSLAAYATTSEVAAAAAVTASNGAVLPDVKWHL